MDALAASGTVLLHSISTLGIQQHSGHQLATTPPDSTMRLARLPLLLLLLATASMGQEIPDLTSILGQAGVKLPDFTDREWEGSCGTLLELRRCLNFFLRAAAGSYDHALHHWFSVSAAAGVPPATSLPFSLRCLPCPLSAPCSQLPAGCLQMWRVFRCEPGEPPFRGYFCHARCTPAASPLSPPPEHDPLLPKPNLQAGQDACSTAISGTITSCPEACKTFWQASAMTDQGLLC